jgi:hypothetical protein
MSFRYEELEESFSYFGTGHHKRNNLWLIFELYGLAIKNNFPRFLLPHIIFVRPDSKKVPAFLAKALQRYTKSGCFTVVSLSKASKRTPIAG